MLKNKKISVLMFVLSVLTLSVSFLFPRFVLAIVFGGPIIEEEPVIEDKICCSNILFIPGFEASRLYLDEMRLLGTSTNKLWEPLNTGDIEKLHMDQQGNSLFSGIYSKDIVDSVPFVGKIYKTFVDSMDDLVKQGSIKKWLAIPYDWRKGVYDIVDDDFIYTIISLSESSKTNKVIIVAHSNGGLIAKTLMRKLESVDKADIIENIIMVTVPELGTPKAITSMLHGYGESIAKGLIMSENEARIFSNNLPGSYGLLPSKKFFEKNPISVISDLFLTNSDILTFDGIKNFLLNNSFSKSIAEDIKNIKIPLLLNPTLYANGESLHSKIDEWKPGETTKVTSIFGWGLPTTQGIVYSKDENKHCKGDDLYSCNINYRVKTNKSGDGTVLTGSRSGNSDILEFFNIDKLNKDKDISISHANVLESTDLLEKITDVIKDEKPTNPGYAKYFSSVEPIDNSQDLRIDIYSPVDIDVYDKNGRHVGLAYNSHYNAYYIDDTYIIHGSFYDDTAGTKTVMVPFGEEYTINLKGNDVGVFIVELSKEIRGETVASTTFSELIATPLMNIELVVGTSSDTFINTSYMNIDVDGDYITDMVSRTDSFRNTQGKWPIRDVQAYLESMRKVIIALKLPEREEKSWLNRIDTIARFDRVRNNNKRVERIIKRLSRDSYKNNKLNNIQKIVILKLFEELIPYIDSTAKGEKKV